MNRKFLELMVKTADLKGFDAAFELYDADQDGTLEGDVDALLAAIDREAAEQREADREAAADDAEAERFERDAYGIDDRSCDHWTTGQVEFHDRLSMGRNDAGEWLGFM